MGQLPDAALHCPLPRPRDKEIPFPRPQKTHFSSSWNLVLGSPLFVRRCPHLLDWGW